MDNDIVARLRTERWCPLTQSAADEIERLRGQIEHNARDRIEYCDAWSKWIEDNDGLEIAQWCRAYADAVPHPNPDGPEIVRMMHSRLDARHRMAADEIERLRAERDAARLEVCMLRAPSTCAESSLPVIAAYADSRGWDCCKESDQ